MWTHQILELGFLGELVSWDPAASISQPSAATVIARVSLRIFLGSPSPPALRPLTPLERAGGTLEGAPSSAGRFFPSPRGRHPKRPDPLLMGTRVQFAPWRVAWKCQVPGWALGAEARLPPPGVALQGGAWGRRVC